MSPVAPASDMMLLLISACAGLTVLALGWVGAVLLGRRDPAWQRVRALADRRGQGDSQSMGQRMWTTLADLLAHLGKPARPSQGWQQSRLRRDLLLAGFRSRSAMNVYLGSRVLSLILMPVLVLLTPLAGHLRGALLPLALVAAAGLGYLLPSFVLDSRSRSRRDRIGRELPDVLDLMVISVEAGLGLDAAIKRVADEVRLSSPILSGELGMVSLELKAGIPRAMALKNMASRCGVDEVSSLVSMLNQADRFGVSVGRSLRVHSDSVRTKRRQKMEEAAAKIPLKLLFPVLFLIFPAIMAVMAGPAIIRVSESILK